MQRPIKAGCLFAVLLLATGGAACAQGAAGTGAAVAPDAQAVPQPIPPPSFIPSRPPPPRSSDTAPEANEDKDGPQGGSGCRYFERKLELIV